MKLASRILGALATAMVAVIMILTFICAVGIVRGGDNAVIGGTDAYSVVAGGLSAALSLLGYVGFVLMCILGGFIGVYLICFIISYIKLCYGKANIQFITYSAALSGIILFFETIMFAFKPSAGWKPFVVLLLYAALMIAYSIVAKKYLKNIEAVKKIKNEKYDEPPEFDFNIKE